jgi:hypothetical protein
MLIKYIFWGSKLIKQKRIQDKYLQLSLILFKLQVMETVILTSNKKNLKKD